MQTTGRVQGHEHHARVLVARQDVTGADRQWAQQYEPGERRALQRRAARPSASTRASMRAWSRCTRRTIASRSRRKSGERVTYDPRRLQGVTLYREADRAFAVGDRVQFTAPYRERHVANRELGTLEADRRQRPSARAARLGAHGGPHRWTNIHISTTATR